MRTFHIALLLTLASLQSLAQRSTGDGHRRRVHREQDGSNIVTFQPFGFAVAYSKANPTVGLDYEYIVSKKLGLGVHVPVMFGFVPPDNFFDNGYQHTMFYIAPGIRFHVGGRRRSLDFSTGPSIVIGNQHYKPNDNYYYGTGITQTAYNLGFTGIAADNVLNIQRGNFIFGFNSRVGYTFDRNNSSRYFMDLGIHFGGRFL